MKKSIAFWSVSLALLLAGKGMAQAGFSMPKTEKEKQVETRLMDAFAGADVNAIPYNSGSTLSNYTDLAGKVDCAAKLQPLSSYPALKAAVSEKNRKAKVSANQVDDLTVDTILNAGWGILTNVEDGKQMLYTAEFHQSPAANWYINGVDYTFFDDNLHPIADFSLRTSDTTHSISIMSQYSAKVFNNDSKREFMVQVHHFDGKLVGQGPIACRDTLYIINEDGEILSKIGNTSGASFHMVPSGFFTEKRVSVFDAYYSDLSDTMHVHIYKPKDLLKETSSPLHTFAIPADLSSYCEGPLAQLMDVDGELYYVNTQYEKPFISNGDQENPEVEMNNKFNIFLYNVSDFTVAKKIQLPLIGIEDNNYSMSSLMHFEDYMFTRHAFNSDDKMEILYAMSRYDISCDCEKLQFYVMDENGNILKDIVEGVSSVIQLQNIPGKSDEYALLMGGGDMVTAIKMLEMPSMKENFTFPAVHENELLSVNFERVPNVNGDYDYVFGLGRGESADNTVYGGIAYYNRDGKSVKRVRINLGANALMFQPIINAMTMNPYVLVPDSKQEYLYFFRYQTATGIGGGFAIANDEKNLYKWTDNETDGSFSGAGLRADETGMVMRNLYLTFVKDGNTKNIFYKLPLVDVVLEGKGTKTEPYIIHTPAELDQVRNYPEAYFELGNDIDMAAFTGVGQKGFLAIPDFKGHFDGKSHYIKNLILAEDGIFSTLNGTVKNLMVKNVVFTATKLNMAGCIAGYLPGGTILNCHVETDLNMDVSGDVLGMIVGQATQDAGLIEQCSFEGNIVAPNISIIGGIAGKLTTGATVSNSYSKGSISALDNVGGIAGNLLNNGTVTNSRSSANISAKYMAGGIVGENSGGRVSRTYATGNIKVSPNPASQWDQGTAGGIAGETVLGTFNGYIRYSFALNDTVISNVDSARVANTEYYVNVNDASAMDSNYALSTMLLGADAEHLSQIAVSDTCLKANRKHGQSGTLDDFTEAFYKSMTWRFGQDSANPWKMTGKMPRLWYEFNVRGVELPYASLTLKKDSSFTMLAHVIPAEATEQGVNWKTSDPRVVSVNQSGVIKGVGAGTATVTAVTKEGKFEASCQVTVVIPVQSVAFEEKEITISPMKVVNISTTVYPEDATNKKVRYYSLNSSVLVVAGTQMMGAEVGDAKLLAVSEDGEASDTCLVHVRILAEDIYLNETNITLNKQKPTFQLEAEVSPEGASADDLVWESSNEAVCTVSDKGLVSGHQKGAADVTVSTPDGSVSAICIVTVEEEINVGNEDETRANVEVCFSKDNFVVTAASEIASVRIYDLSGQSLSYTAGIAAEQAWIPAARYAAGIYLVKVELLNGGSAIVKVIKR